MATSKRKSLDLATLFQTTRSASPAYIMADTMLTVSASTVTLKKNATTP